MKIKHPLLTATLLLGFSSVLHAAEQTATRTLQVDLTTAGTITTTYGGLTGTQTLTTATNSNGTRSISDTAIDTVGFRSDNGNASYCEMYITSPNVVSTGADAGKFVLMPSSGSDSSPISFSLRGTVHFMGTIGNISVSPSSSVTANSNINSIETEYAVSNIRNNWNTHLTSEATSGHAYCGMYFAELFAENFSSIPSDVTGTRTAQINFLMRVI